MGKQGQAQAVPAAIKASASYGGLISNGDFAAGGAGWTAAPGASVNFTGNIATFNAACTLSRPLNSSFYVGAKYTVSFTISGWTAGTVASSVGAGASSPTHGANGSFSDIVTAGSTPQSLALSVAGASVALAVDNIMVTLYALKPIEVAAPSLAGTGYVGQAFTLTDAAWNEKPAGSSVPAWYADGVVIAGQTGWNYIAQPEDMGKTITGRTTRTNSEGSTQSSVSNGIVVSSNNLIAPVIAFEDEATDPTQFFVTNRPAYDVGEIWQTQIGADAGFASSTIYKNDVDSAEALAGQLDFVTSASGTTYIRNRFNGGPWSNTLVHAYPAGLFGAGTPAGNVLGSEPDGMAVDVAADQILIRDSTGAKNFLGTLSTKYPTGVIPITDLPLFSYLVGSMWAQAVPNGATTTEVMIEVYDLATLGAAWRIQWCQNGNPNVGLIISTGYSPVVNIDGSGPGPKHAMRWQTDNTVTYSGGVPMRPTDTDCAMPDGIDRFHLWGKGDGTNAWTGTKVNFAWVPRALSDAELAAKSA